MSENPSIPPFNKKIKRNKGKFDGYYYEIRSLYEEKRITKAEFWRLRLKFAITHQETLIFNMRINASESARILELMDIFNASSIAHLVQCLTEETAKFHNLRDKRVELLMTTFGVKTTTQLMPKLIDAAFYELMKKKKDAKHQPKKQDSPNAK